MLKLSLDTTNSINICQEEIYHPTTAGSKVSILPSDSVGLTEDSWTVSPQCVYLCFLCRFFTLTFLLIKSTFCHDFTHIFCVCSSCFTSFPTLQHTTGTSTEVFKLVMIVQNDCFFFCLPVMKVPELVPGSLPDCCFITESSIDNFWIQIGRL